MNTKEKLLKTGYVKDNEYLDKYVHIIESNLTTVAERHKTQKHHIVPKCIFKYNKEQVDNSTENTVNLYYCEHLRAHYYLCKCSSNNKFTSANALSIRYILKGKSLDEFDIDSIDEDELQKFYEKSKEYVYEITHTQECCNKIQNTLYGRPSPNKGNFYGVKNKIEKTYTELGEKRRGKGNPFYGKKHSQDSKDKIAVANGIPINMLDVKTKKVIREFISINSASKYLIEIGATRNRSCHKRITDVCNSHNLSFHAYGYSWEYKEGVTTIPTGSKAEMLPSEAHHDQKVDEIV